MSSRQFGCFAILFNLSLWILTFCWCAVNFLEVGIVFLIVTVASSIWCSNTWEDINNDEVYRDTSK